MLPYIYNSFLLIFFNLIPIEPINPHPINDIIIFSKINLITPLNLEFILINPKYNIYIKINPIK